MVIHYRENLSAAGSADSIKTGSTLSSEKIMLLKTVWSGSSNPASLSLFGYPYKIGKAYIGTGQEDGDFRLYQEPRRINTCNFYTCGYAKLKKWNFYGNFNYYSEKDKNVKWVDVMEPYTDNPYTLGDSIGGNYFKEYFKMEAKSAYLFSELLTIGFDVKYKAGSGAKRKDPRPENVITSFSFIPSVLFKLNKFMLGANLRYEEGKEDIEISTVTGNTFNLFYFKGLGAYSSTTEEDDRTDKKSLYGGGFQFCFSKNKTTVLAEINSYKEETDIKRSKKYPVQIVMLTKYNTDVATTITCRPSEHRLHKLNLNFTGKRIYGQEPVLEAVAEAANYQWSAVDKYTLYWYKAKDFSCKYSYYRLADNDHFNWGGSLSGGIHSGKTTYYFVPEYNRQKINQIYLDAVLEKSYTLKSSQFILSLNGGYRKGMNCSLELVDDEELLAAVNTEFVDHDFGYQKSRVWETGASLQFGKKLGTDVSSQFQLFAEISYKKISSDFSGNSQREKLELNVGINF